MSIWFIAQAICAFLVAFCAIPGETWRKEPVSTTRPRWRAWLSRITPTGWIVAALLLAALGISFLKEWSDNDEKRTDKTTIAALRDDVRVIKSQTAPPDVVQQPRKPPDVHDALNALVVKQVVQQPADDKQNPHTITLSVDTSPADVGLMNRVDKVIYFLDPNSYPQPIVEVANPVGGFRYSFGAFASTDVKAKIFLTNPDETVVRSGRISMSEPQTFSK
jgi:hypothetical protein